MGLRMGQAEEQEKQEDIVPLRDAATARKDLDQRRRRRGRSAGKFTPRLVERRTMARVMGDFGESATETSTVPRITRRRLVHDTMRPPDEKDELVPRLVHRRRGPALLKRSYNPVQVRSPYTLLVFKMSETFVGLLQVLLLTIWALKWNIHTVLYCTLL